MRTCATGAEGIHKQSIGSGSKLRRWKDWPDCLQSAALQCMCNYQALNITEQAEVTVKAA